MATNQENNELENWKTDFPVQKEEATHVSRREFAKFLCLLSGGFALGNGLVVLNSVANPKEELQGEHFVCNADEVPVGEMKQFIVSGNKDIPYILIHLEENKWRAFEQKCTHLSCAVLYRADINKIECPCHRGFFNPDTGEVLAGPPPRPLPQLQVVMKNEKIYVVAYKESQAV